MRTLLVNALRWVVLLASIVNADAAISDVNNTDPGCDDVAGAPLCAISAAINEALSNNNRTYDLTVNGQRARGCAGFGGRWEASMSGGVRCSVAPSVNQPFSFIGPLDVAQNGCRFSYSDIGGRQRGKIRGRTIKIAKPKIPRGLLNLFRLDSVKAKGRGRVQDQDRANTRISAQLKGEIHGIRTSCTVKWTTNFVRLPPIVPPPPPPPPVPPPPPPPPGGFVGFLGTVVSADYHFPDLGTVLYAGGTAVVRGIDFDESGGPDTEFINLGAQNIQVDFYNSFFRITYLNGWSLGGGPKTFDGLVMSVISAETPRRIIRVLVTSTNIPGYNDAQLSFDASHVFVNQLGFSSFPSGSFIDLNVAFSQ